MPTSTVVPDGVASVQLSRRDFFYYTWTRALQRPILPFLLYSFALLFLLGITGVWPTARIFSLAVLPPLLGYLLWVWVSAQLLWARYPALREMRCYRFKAKSYQLDTGGHRVNVAYHELAQALSSRRALYLVRQDGSADILPKSALPGGLEAFLKSKLEVERSSFL